MGRREPPNIDEVGNLVLLRQALDVLGASGPEQLGLFPPGCDAGREIASLFADAMDRVRPVFWSSFAPEAREGLQAIERILATEPTSDQAILGATQWDELRSLARRAIPIPGWSRAAPRPWLEQIVRHRGRLCLRRQLEGAAPCP